VSASDIVQAVVCIATPLGALITCLIKDRQNINELRKSGYQS
jgi:hypothetical protein